MEPKTTAMSYHMPRCLGLRAELSSPSPPHPAPPATATAEGHSLWGAHWRLPSSSWVGLAFGVLPLKGSRRFSAS